MSEVETRKLARKIFKEFLLSVDKSEREYRRNANTSDIIATIEHAFPEAVKLTKGIAPFFTHGHHLKTLDQNLNICYNVWRFLKLQIQYQKDPPDRQDIRKPNRFIWSKRGDCKSYSLFAASVLANLGFKVSFRYTAYRAGIPYKHVYVIAEKGGKKYIIDGVYKLFNEEKPYFAVKTNPMNTYILGALDERKGSQGKVNLKRFGGAAGLQARINKSFDRALSREIKKPSFQRLSRADQIKYIANFKRRAQMATRARLSGLDGIAEIGKLSKEQRAARKKKRREKTKRRNKKIKEGLKKFGRGVLTVTLGAGRGAFLALVALNVNGMASKMKKLIQMNKFQQMDKKWKQLGGIHKLFHKAIDKGAKKKPLFLSKKAKRKFKALGLHGICDEGLGAIPIAAAAAAAAPVLAALIPLLAKVLKSSGMHADAQQVEEGAASVVEEATPIANQELQQVGENPADFEDAPGGSGEEYEEDTNEVQQEADEETEGGASEDAAVEGGDDIWGALGQLAGKAVTAITKKIKKKNPKVGKAIAKVGQGIDDYAAGVYLRQSGYRKTAEDFGQGINKIKKVAQNNMMPLVLAGGLGLALVIARKK